MICLLDESGDTGGRYNYGSSKYFIMSMVCVEESNAMMISNLIDELKIALGYSAKFEFHFRENSYRQRMAFLELMKQVDFNYFGVVYDKKSYTFDKKKNIYKTALSEIFQLYNNKLLPQKIVFDEIFGKRDFIPFRKYVKEMVGATVKNVNQEPSHKNNLLQLADYTAGIINCLMLGKSEAFGYYDMIRTKSKTILIK